MGNTWLTRGMASALIKPQMAKDMMGIGLKGNKMVKVGLPIKMANPSVAFGKMVS